MRILKIIFLFIATSDDVFAQKPQETPTELLNKIQFITPEDGDDIASKANQDYDPNRDYRLRKNESGEVVFKTRNSKSIPEKLKIWTEGNAKNQSMLSFLPFEDGWICSFAGGGREGKVAWVSKAQDDSYEITQGDVNELNCVSGGFLLGLGNFITGEGGVYLIEKNRNNNRLEVTRKMQISSKCIISADYIEINDKNYLLLNCDHALRISEWGKPYLIEINLDPNAGIVFNAVSLQNADIVIARPGVCWLLRRSTLYLKAEPFIPLMKNQ